MFTKELPEGLFSAQREFVAKMDANRDFVWWADTLVTEETRELKEAFEAPIQDMENIFKELADLIYVVAGFYNVMSNYGPELVDAETNARIERIMNEAADIVTKVTNELRIPLPIIVAAFEIVHASNMSKINPETGKPDRREDGKILKGPNYIAPSMAKPVAAWRRFNARVTAKRTLSNAKNL